MRHRFWYLNHWNNGKLIYHETSEWERNEYTESGELVYQETNFGVRINKKANIILTVNKLKNYPMTKTNQLTIAQFLKVKDFPFAIKDKNGKEIYWENSNGYWSKREFDANNNQIYYEDPTGYWSKKEFDVNNNEIYYEDSNGHWSKREYDANNNQIYREDSRGYWSKHEFDANNNQIYYENSNGDWYKKEFDAKNNKIYFENSTGYWSKQEFNANNNLIYREDSNGVIEDNRPKLTVELTMDEIATKFGINIKQLKIKK